MSTEADKPTKVCPDCAETVLRAARKCRFCGFRFDGAQPEAEQQGLGLFGFRRRTRPSTVPAVLAGWGLELEDEEQVGAFVMAEVDGANGFLVLTSSRFLFFEGNGKQCTLVQERALAELEDVELVRSGLRRRLRIAWDSATTVVGSLERELMRDLHDRLRTHVRA